MTKNEELDKLFKVWEDKIPEYKGKFVSDGIISEALYDTASKKILFIAKEPNDPKPEEAWDFRILWRDQFKYPFTYRIAEWAFGLLIDFPPYDDLWDKFSDNLPQSLQSIAFMNVKKIGGAGNSEYLEIKKHVEIEKDFILQEIEIIKPDIIILGLSFWYEIRVLIFGKVDWLKSGYGIKIAKWNGTKVIDFYHPSSRNAPAAAYSLLQNVVQANKFKNL